MSVNYTFRRLNAADIFLMCKILGKIGVDEILKQLNDEKIKALFSGAKKRDTETDFISLGLYVAEKISNVLFANLAQCEAEIYQMLSQTSDLTVEQVKTMDAADFIGMVIAFIRKDEFRDFLSVASKSLK